MVVIQRIATAWCLEGLQPQKLFMDFDFILNFTKILDISVIKMWCNIVCTDP